MLAGGDHRVDVEEGEVAGQLGDRPVGGDRMCAMLDVGIGEDLDVVGPERRTVAERFGGLAFDESLVGDESLRPLSDPVEAGAAGKLLRADGRSPTP